VTLQVLVDGNQVGQVRDTAENLPRPLRDFGGHSTLSRRRRRFASRLVEIHLHLPARLHKPFLGSLLADLAVGIRPQWDLAAFSLRRGAIAASWHRHQSALRRFSQRPGSST
jgi:hypothetical protein